MDKSITLREFVEKVEEKEGIKLRIWGGDQADKVPDYDYDRKAADSTTITDFLETRINPKLGSIKPEIMDGNFTKPHGRTSMGKLRSTYDR